MCRAVAKKDSEEAKEAAPSEQPEEATATVLAHQAIFRRHSDLVDKLCNIAAKKQVQDIQQIRGASSRLYAFLRNKTSYTFYEFSFCKVYYRNEVPKFFSRNFWKLSLALSPIKIFHPKSQALTFVL